MQAIDTERDAGVEESLRRASIESGIVLRSESDALPEPRPLYSTDGCTRPWYRGKIMHQLLGVWPFLCCAHYYVVNTSFPPPESKPYLNVYRVLVAVSTWMCIAISDKFHNSDRWLPGASSTELTAHEVYWIKRDYISISFILFAHLLLWAAHTHWAMHIPYIFVGSLTCISVIIGKALGALDGVAPPGNYLVDGKAGAWINGAAAKHIVAIKVCLAMQYAVLFGWMMLELLFTSCWTVPLIWFWYLPGFLCYALQVPTDNGLFSAHDIFHAFILTGHLASMVVDYLHAGNDCDASQPGGPFYDFL